MSIIAKIKKELKQLSNKEKALILKRFFKTGASEYGEGDIFIGVTVPNQRIVAKKYYLEISFEELRELINSKIHEHRLCACIILIYKFKKTKVEAEKTKIYKFLIKNISKLNNWDLVDITCPKIIGSYIFNNKRELDKIYSWSKSNNLWLKRISILSLFYFIKKNEFNEVLTVIKTLLNDKHDLIHKANGWMLREIAKIDQALVEEFIIKHYANIPRTTIRYSIERFDEKKRKYYLNYKTKTQVFI